MPRFACFAWMAVLWLCGGRGILGIEGLEREDGGGTDGGSVRDAAQADTGAAVTADAGGGDSGACARLTAEECGKCCRDTHDEEIHEAWDLAAASRCTCVAGGCDTTCNNQCSYAPGARPLKACAECLDKSARARVHHRGEPMRDTQVRGGPGVPPRLPMT